MTKLYVDATCEGWQITQGKAKGTILVFIPQQGRVKQRAITETFEIIDPTLKQFINRFELSAILKANEQKYKNKVIYSDSQVAVGWAKKQGVNAIWIRREENLAGHILEEAKYG